MSLNFYLCYLLNSTGKGFLSLCFFIFILCVCSPEDGSLSIEKYLYLVFARGFSNVLLLGHDTLELILHSVYILQHAYLSSYDLS